MITVQYTVPHQYGLRVSRKDNEFGLHEKVISTGKWIKVGHLHRWGLAEALLLNYYRLTPQEVHTVKVTLEQRVQAKRDAYRAAMAVTTA